MVERESKVIIGCRECEEKSKELRHGHGVTPLFPTTTAYTKYQLSEISQGYVCPFCRKKLIPSLAMTQMFQRFTEGTVHIVSMEKEVEIHSEFIKCAIPIYEPIPSLKEYLFEQGVQIENDDFDEMVFRHPEEDIALLQQAMKDFDREQWFIVIESGHHPEPFPLNEDFWFDLFDDDLGI